MIRELAPSVYAVGAIDWDRRLFDELIPLPEGTTYNSYLVRGNQKTALIDSVDPTKDDELLQNLVAGGVTNLDYVVSNHAEQDHSGSIPKLLERYPNAAVVTNSKCRSMLMDLLHIPQDKFLEVGDRATLSLGNKTLEFIIAPWVHWPETMFTYLKENAILFPCDLFGSHLATSDLYATDETTVYVAAKRYYAEIMMPFRPNIRQHMEKLAPYDIRMIAPSHGPVYARPEFILNAYQDWISDDVKNEVVIPYVSMHGSTETMVKYLINALMKRNIVVKPYNLTKTDIGELAMALVDAATLVIGSPTVLLGPHPAVIYATYLANVLRPKTRFASVIGSFGWAGKLLESITGMVSNLHVELLAPVIVKGHPRDTDFAALDRLADDIRAKHEAIRVIQ